jgi:hypothetical protein
MLPYRSSVNESRFNLQGSTLKMSSTRRRPVVFQSFLSLPREFLLNRFRNRDLRTLLCQGEPKDEKEARRLSAAVTRKIRLLRVHGEIQKVTNTQRYVITEYGRAATTVLAAAQNADVNRLLTAA